MSLLLAIVVPIGCTTQDDIDRLSSDLLKNYNARIRPPYNNSDVLTVHISLILVTIIEYDDVSGVLSVVGSASTLWNDNRLQWNAAKYSGTSMLLLPRSLLWFPPIFVINSADELNIFAADTSLMVRIFSNGNVLDASANKMKTTCISDMTYFPFDKQTCTIMLGIWNYWNTEAVLECLGSSIDLSYYTPHNIWDMHSSSCETFPDGLFKGVVQYSVTLKRKSLYFCVNMLAPMLLLILLTPLVFVLPVDSGERISFAVTIFLSMAVFMTLVADNLPKSSTSMARTSSFLLVSLLYSVSTITAAMLNMRLYHSNPNTKYLNIIKRIQYVLQLRFVFCCRRCKMRNRVKEKNCEFHDEGLTDCQILARTFDRIAISYSIAFILAVVVAYLLSVVNAP